MSHRIAGRRSGSVIAALVLPLALAVGLASCGDPSTEEPATSDVTGDPLAGRTFLSTAATGIELVDATVVRIQFRDGFVSASAGCNSLGGTYVVDGDRIVVGPVGGTEMGCEQALMEQDERIAVWLAAGPTFVLDGDTLVLTAADESVTFLDREVADPDRPLEDTSWTLTGTLTADAASSAPTGQVATLRIVDGTAAVDTGCNTGSAPVTIGENTLEFGALALTRTACAEPLMTAEAFIAEVLTGTVSYEIEAGNLTIMNGDIGLQYSASDGS